jgi:F-type H+-transporting ATPase subunit epsilon
MAGTFKDATQVVVPGLEGDFAVLPGHAPVISALRPGVVVVTLPDASRTRIFVKGGFAEVDPQHLTVLAERALDVEAMDAGTIAAELAAAEAELAAAGDDTARLAATSALDQLRALQRG